MLESSQLDILAPAKKQIVYSAVVKIEGLWSCPSSLSSTLILSCRLLLVKSLSDFTPPGKFLVTPPHATHS